MTGFNASKMARAKSLVLDDNKNSCVISVHPSRAVSLENYKALPTGCHSFLVTACIIGHFSPPKDPEYLADYEEETNVSIPSVMSL